MSEYYNCKTTREQHLLEVYCNNEILACPELLDTDGQKIYKLSILESLYNPRLQEDFMLLHHLKRMYDVNRVEAVLRSSDLLYKRDTGVPFGYNISFELFACHLTSPGEDEFGVEIFLDPSSNSYIGLENLQVQIVHNSHVKPASMFSSYASMTAHFVNYYRIWSTRFHGVLDDFLKHLYD